MSFDNKNIIKEDWKVIYVDDAYAVFIDLANKIYGNSSAELNNSIKSSNKDILSSIVNISENKIIESYSWLIVQRAEVENSSGFNSFYGTAPKLGKQERQKRLEKIYNNYKNSVSKLALEQLLSKLNIFCFSDNKLVNKFELRDKICSELNKIGNKTLSKDVKSLVFRPLNEMYIPIPDARAFHTKHPNFFGNNIGTFLKDQPSKLALKKEDRAFTLIFEPSGTPIKAFISQDNGKGIESAEKQSLLGEWLRNGVFQLGEYEPLTKKKLDQLGINGIRIYKTQNKLFENNSEFPGEEVHLEFIWIEV